MICVLISIRTFHEVSSYPFPMVFAHCEALSLGRELLRSPVPGQRLEVLGALKALFEAGAFQGCSLPWKIDWKFWLYDNYDTIWYNYLFGE